MPGCDGLRGRERDIDVAVGQAVGRGEILGAHDPSAARGSRAANARAIRGASHA